MGREGKNQRSAWTREGEVDEFFFFFLQKDDKHGRKKERIVRVRFLSLGKCSLGDR